MLNEFYKYIANSMVSFFQSRKAVIRPGERYCLRLDTEEMVAGVDQALRSKTLTDGIQGSYQYGDVYDTFTIRLSASMEVVVASRINGMTDDFLATLRNAELTENHYPILMITHSPIDTITSGTGDLAANGMPFHAASIISKIKEDIRSAELPVADRTLLELELARKQGDRFSDKSSLFEYSNLLTVLGRGYVEESDFAAFSLLYDNNLSAFTEDEIKRRLQDNHVIFEQIDRVVRHANIADALDKEYDNAFIEHLETSKKKGKPWHEGYTYDMVKASHDRIKRKQDNPLRIDDEGIEVFSGSAIECSFPLNESTFMRNDGETKTKQRRKNIIIYNPDQKPVVTVLLSSNLSIKSTWVECIGAECALSGKKMCINIRASGCAFSRVIIKDPNNNITYLIKVCVLNILPRYLESIQTSYLLDIPKNIKRATIQAIGLNKKLVINPGHETEITEAIKPGGEYICNYNQTLLLSLDEEDIDIDSGCIDLKLKCGAIDIPIRIKDEAIKPVELTGAAAFKWKYKEKRGLEYREGKIVSGTTEYFAKAPFKDSLAQENALINNGWMAALDSISGLIECQLDVPENVKTAYTALIKEFKRLRQLPSLAYYTGDLRTYAESYVSAVEEEFQKVPAGQTLTSAQNDLLLLGCVIKNYDERIISMSPLHPLNVLYQLNLLEENDVGEIRENLIEKLSPLYLLPYIKDGDKTLYHAIERKHSPEWRVYAQLSNKRYQGTRNFVQKLVRDKITQYIDHFKFLFDDLGNDQFCINLINMGDCREVLQGLILFYVKELKAEISPEELKHFVINIYSQAGDYNEFSVLSDQKKLREYISEYGKDVEDIGEMTLILGKNIRCYYRNPLEETYRYAHLTFYEMESSEDSGDSRMDSITTGVALGGLTSGTPSVLSADWYKTGFGTKYVTENRLVSLAKKYNSMFRVAFSGSSYEPGSAIFTEIAHSEDGQLGKIYSSSNWVVFVDPKVDLSFFKESKEVDQKLMLIHYSDQYTSASGYDDITVTQKSEQYEEIIREQLAQKGVLAQKEDVHNIISLFNAFNGGWMLRLITAPKLTGAVDSNFSREKMSILSAVKLCMAYYSHKDIVWVPISLEEMLRVSGGAGYSQKDGLLSAKNLGFEKGATSDDLLMVGIEGPVEDLKVYLHPVEVKIGQIPSGTINKAREQVLATYNGLWKALWPENGRNALECKLSRNFLMQLVIVCCEKMKLYNVYPDEQWDRLLEDYREALMNEQYSFSTAMDTLLGKGTVISFKSGVLNESGLLTNDVCLLEFPEKMGSQYMIKSAHEIEQELDNSGSELPGRLKTIYIQSENSPKVIETAVVVDQQEAVIPDISAVPASQEVSSKSDAEEIMQDPVPEDVKTTDLPAEALDNRKGMEILFGTDSTTGNELFWLPNDTNQVFHTNTGIIGTMGTGKTQFTKSIITQLYRDQAHNFDGTPLGILIFDYKGDYNESKEDFIDATNAKVYKPYHLPFNPLALTKSKVFKPLLPIHTANAFKDTLTKVYGLGAKQQNTLFSCITKAYAAKGISPGDPSTWDNDAPTFDMVYSIYANDDDIKKNDSLAAAMDKLYQFQVFEGDPSQTQSLFDTLNGVVVVDLSGYDADIQSLIVAITLDLFYVQMQAAGSSKMDQQYRQLTKLILVDEADNFMSEGFPSLKKILKEGREFGVGTILSTQFLKHFCSTDDDYAKYILTWVVHNVADLKTSDVEFVFKTESKSSETQNLFNDIKALQKHHSIVKIGTSRPRYIEDKAFWELYKEIKMD